MPYKIRPQNQKEVAQMQVVSRGQALMESLSERPQLIWGGIALLFVVAVVTFFMQSARNNAEEAAWTIEAEASKLLHDPPPLPKPIEEGDEDAPLEIMNETQRIEKSLEHYAEILAKHGDTDAARIALFESANAYAKLQKDEQAVEKYTAFISLWFCLISGWPILSRKREMKPPQLIVLGCSTRCPLLITGIRLVLN